MHRVTRRVFDTGASIKLFTLVLNELMIGKLSWKRLPAWIIHTQSLSAEDRSVVPYCVRPCHGRMELYVGMAVVRVEKLSSASGVARMTMMHRRVVLPVL
eukprot:2341938-Amphidinium_carterae.2